MIAPGPLFALRNVSFAYPGSEALALAGVTLDIQRGDYVALLGPNGAGKSTLLRLLAGVLAPRGGEIDLDGRPLRGVPRRTLARRIAVLPQRLQLAFDTEVEDLVAIGRTPYRSRFGGLWGGGDRDRTAVEAALQATDTARFRRRTVQELSGGEQQRVALALALAQEADVLLLDEPTSHLDPYQSQAVLDLVGAVRRERHLTVVAVFHDLNLSALYAERIVLIDNGGLAADGPPAAVLRADVLDRTFGPCLRFVVHPQHGVPQALPAGASKGARPGAAAPQECAS